jgi:dTDP-4-dehydrorhamnose 3,5-epimerase
VQDNHSLSGRGVLRGLHYQIEHPQGKLVRVIEGAVFDVAVDLRRSSPTFGMHVGLELSAAGKEMLWIPPGFAHGFIVLSAAAQFLYKTTDYWYPEHERTLLWNDPALGIEWPFAGPPILAAKDAAGRPLADADAFA